MQYKSKWKGAVSELWEQLKCLIEKKELVQVSLLGQNHQVH